MIDERDLSTTLSANAISAASAAAALIERALAAGGQDNVALVVANVCS
jgi:hypothetical protein